tara:strand:+ start:3078 stop:4481 length:1404 start_codon:yes stop_codon:yes gene_type:complete
MKPLSVALTILITFGFSTLARADYFPELSNGKGLDTQQFPFGPLGGIFSVTYETNQATIISLAEDGPASKADLKPGDILTGVSGKKFSTYSSEAETGGDGLPLELGMAILDAQDKGTPLILTVQRGDKTADLQIALPRVPAFTEDFPANCSRSAELISAACDYLAKSQKSNGTFQKKGEYSNAFAALALLASGDKKYQSEINRTVRGFVDDIDSDGPPASNWHTSAVGILLAEYFLATADDSVLQALEACCNTVMERLEPENGRLGHSESKLPYNGKALVITSSHAHLMWALAAKAGIDINWDRWDHSYQSVEAAIGKNGNVGYNFSARGDYQSMARTGSVATALTLAEKSPSDLKGMNRWMGENHKRSTNCHAVTSMALIFGFMGNKNNNPKAFRETMNYHRWLLALAQPFDQNHGAYYFGKRANFGGDKYLGLRTVGNYQTVLILTSAKNDTLWSFGNRNETWYD